MKRLPVPIDRETNDSLEMIVCVGDGKSTTCELFNITVLDVNDNTPTFIKDILSVKLFENFGNDYYTSYNVYNMSAIDKDVGKNAKLTYEIITSNKTEVKFYFEDGVCHSFFFILILNIFLICKILNLALNY